MSNAVPVSTPETVPVVAPGSGFSAERVAKEAEEAKSKSATAETIAAEALALATPGEWVELGNLEKVEAGGAEWYKHGVRKEGGIARLRGTLKTIEALAAGVAVIAKIPAGLRPILHGVNVLTHVGKAGALPTVPMQTEITTSGELRLDIAEPLALGSIIYLDGTTWSIT